MYKIMLVDDEIGVRSSIKAKINWEAAGFHIESEAANGLEALELLEGRGLPDVVISDVRMPRMDGIAFMKACRDKYPGLRIIVLSGYSDFEYMKAAIQLGVKDYLLKPVVRSELTDLLAKLSAELKEEKNRSREQEREQLQTSRHLRTLQEQLIWQLVKDEDFSLAAVRERLRQLQLTGLAGEGLQVRFAAVEMRVPPGRLDDWSERKELLAVAFQMVCRESAEPWPNVYPLYDYSYPSMMYCLLTCSGGRPDELPVEDMLRELQRNIKRYLRVETVTGLGDWAVGLQGLRDAYASCMLDWSQGTVQQRGVGGQLEKETVHTLPAELERKLVLSLENLDAEGTGRILREIFHKDGDLSMFAFTFLSFRIILLLSSIAKKFELGAPSLQQHLWNCQMTLRQFHSRDQVVDQLKILAELVMNEVRKTRSSGGQQLAEAVRRYVEENYAYELSLASLAERFHINETYLSGLFKQKAGFTFSDYVTKLRMEKAASLMEESGLKLTDIATLVGYSSSSYFSTVFKKYYGVSPKEYRDALPSRLP
ncbi:response regulator transcription factor [Paenibacillus mucilaginosus]|uniref:YijO n=1 Tax=Paenibacillus mucilaginosus (strain KNP414) TaxID=1036673 RepID=F8FRG8_PAEMK|nr:helix-turn-helix domain-containing protein [Paenibacillus mucilaginosus]AEI40525.1 YijO [Paenibacillus mucilaginosus KNP414]MCG7216333.1 response regulator [Paenibacillus mucilaginosus]WDM29693.1 response regulator [Paenibacillus mucilaginosus]